MAQSGTDKQGGAGRAGRVHDAMAAASPVVAADIGAAAELHRLRRKRALRRALPAADILDQKELGIASGAVLAAGLVSGRPRLARAGAEMLTGLVIATAIKTAAKQVVTRTRPSVVAETGEHEFTLSSEDDSDDQAFPSGHTAGAVTAIAPLLRHAPALGTPLIPVVVGLLGLQLVRGAHYPSDIAAGGAVGALATGLAHRAVDAVWRGGFQDVEQA